jgi:hypothetical protein
MRLIFVTYSHILSLYRIEAYNTSNLEWLEREDRPRGSWMISPFIGVGTWYGSSILNGAWLTVLVFRGQ